MAAAECVSVGVLSLTLSVLKKFLLITVYSEIAPADESCRMFCQQNRSNKDPKLFNLKREFASILPVGLRKVSCGLSLTFIAVAWLMQAPELQSQSGSRISP